MAIQNAHIKSLSELKTAIVQGDVDKLKILNNNIAFNGDLKKSLTIDANPFGSTNAVIFACKERQVEILQYLLSRESKIIENSTGSIQPTDEDETHHNAFYYAMRSGSPELVQMLIRHFSVHLQELDEIMSRAYEELKINNVPLSDEVKFFIEQQLINVRFDGTDLQRSGSVEDFIKTIKERVALVAESAKFVREKHSTTAEIDEECLYILKFVARNINVLKQKLKSTYGRLPWEEIEFCLTIFISTYCTKQEINLYWKACLEDHKMLTQLESFLKRLACEIDNLSASRIGDLTAPIRQKRSLIVESIISSCPEFESLYEMYHQIRDIHSLERICEILKIGLGADVREREGKILISRMLQVLGEYMKNTLESPKLSDGTNAILLVALPKSTRRLVLSLRDSIAHIESLFKRTEIENNKEDAFFNGILADLKNIGSVVDDMLQAKKNNILSELINKISDAKTFDEYCKAMKPFEDNLNIDFFENNNFEELLNNRIIKLVEELSRIVPDQTDYEKQLFQLINSECRSVQGVLCDVDRRNALFILFSHETCVTEENFRDVSEVWKLHSKTTQTSNSKYPNFQKIGRLVADIYQNVKARSVQAYVNDFEQTMWHVIGMIAKPGVKWIQDLEYKLKEELPPRTSSKKTNIFTHEKYRKELSKKKQELESILNKRRTSSQSFFETFVVYKEDKKLQAVVEMLVLDIMSILAALKVDIGKDFLFVDDVCPVLVGKCLRNHLAHNNELVTLLLDDPDRVIFLNAIKLAAENVAGNEKKQRLIPCAESISCLNNRHDNCRRMLSTKRVLFAACEKGSIDALKTSIRNGADVNSRGREGHGVLYFASKGGSTELLQFLLDLDRSLSLSTPELEIAVSSGRRHTVEFIVERLGMPSDDTEEDRLSLLHIAAKNGHKDVVEYLIENKSDPKKYNNQGLPIHYAAQCNHKNVVEVLLKNGYNSVDDRNVGGLSLLHIAADFGYIELVEYLLELGADVNAKSRDFTTPLHLASNRSNLEVAKILVAKGANVNSRILNGLSSIYFASNRNYVNVVSFLLDHGANVNTADKVSKNTSLHVACRKGYKNIVEVLLEKGADVNLCNIDGISPIHLAVAGGHYEIFLILLAHGADLHIKTKIHETLLHCAAKCGQQAIAVTLIDRKLEINAISINNVTPLFVAAYNGHVGMVDLLIKKGALVDLQNKEGWSPLHAAVSNNQKDIIQILMKSGAQLDVINNSGQSPLYIAIVNDHSDVMYFLIEHGAAITDKEFQAAIVKGNINMVKLMASKHNIKDKSSSLHLAVEREHMEIVKFLINHGFHVDICEDDTKFLMHAVSKNNKELLGLLVDNRATNGNGEPINQALFAAVELGHPDMVDILLEKCGTVDKVSVNGMSLLLEAAQSGSIAILKSVIKKCNNLDVASHGGATALHAAAHLGHKEIVEILLDKGANVNAVCDDGTALHLAAGQNHNPEIAELLLSKGADVTIEDKKQRTALQLAVANNRLEIVKTLLSGSGKKYINYTGTAEGLTLLHIAAQRLNMDMVKYLIEQGADMDIKNVNGAKPIHHAARDGSIEIVEYFLSKGSSLSETGHLGRTLLHYATMKGQIKVVEYLIGENANINAQTSQGQTPLHYCVLYGSYDVARILLNNGAMYNVVNKRNKKPEDMEEELNFNMSEKFLKDIKCDSVSNVIKQRNEIVALLRSTDKLLKAVKRNDICAVRKCIAEGAVLNAKDIRENMALHYASWKGYAPIAEVLLFAKAKPNVSVKDGSTPLHYSAKFSHFNVAKILLSHGARYNSINDSKSTPLDLATDAAIKNLLKVTDDLFKYVAKGSDRALSEIQKIKDSEILRAVMNARNENNKTLLMVAKLCHFPKLKEFTSTLFGDKLSSLVANDLCCHEKYDEALKVYQCELEQIKIKLGTDNFALLEVKQNIARVLYKQYKCDEALSILTEVYDLQKEHLGSDHKDALNTRGSIALILHRQGKNNEALDIYNDIYYKQKKYLKLTSVEMSNTQLHMALVLDHLQRYEEALKLNNEIYEAFRKAKGEYNQTALIAKNNIAINLSNMGQYDKAIETYEEVFKRRTHVFGPSHSDTLRPLHNIAAAYLSMGRYKEAITRLEHVFEIQRKAFGMKHRDTISTQFNLGHALFRQGETIVALKTLREYMINAEPMLGPEHDDIIVAREIIQSIEQVNYTGWNDTVAHLNDTQKKLNIAAGEGAEQNVVDLINDEVDVNYVDEDGRSALYYAVYNGNVGIVKILLENSASMFQVTNKGNTLFHAAASKGYAEIVEVLLEHANSKEHTKVIELINTRTTTSGSTPLHVAAKTGSYKIVISLLKRGVAFDIRNNEGLIPSEVCQHQDIISLFEFVQNIFMYALNGNSKCIITQLQNGNSDQVKAAIRVRNFQSLTLLQAVLLNCEVNIALHVVSMLKDEELVKKTNS